MRLYNYIKNEPGFNIDQIFLKDKNIPDSVLCFSVSFLSPYESTSAANDLVYSELFFKKEFFTETPCIDLPCGEKTYTDYFKYYKKEIPLVIFLHGFSSKNERLQNYHKFINSILDHNAACLFINLPFHLNRNPADEESGSRLLYYDDADTLLFFHQCVVDVRKAIDVIEKLLSPVEINICGISLGSLVSVITMAMDKRINKGILIVGGGNWSEIHWAGILKFKLKGNCAGNENITREKCRIYYSNFPYFLEKIKSLNPDYFTFEMDEDESLKKLCTKKCYLCDPLVFAHKINPGKVLMINSWTDHFFSRKSSLMLWEELGKPEIHWFIYLHLSGILNKKPVRDKIFSFLKAN